VLVQPQAGGINQVRRAVERAAQTAIGLRHQCSKQRLEHRTRAVCVGIGERRAGNLARAQVVQSHRLAVHPGHRLAQTAEARQLPDQQRHELTLRGERPHPFVRLVRRDQIVEHLPWKVVQHPVQDRIPMLHRATLFVSMAAKQCHHRVESAQVGRSAKFHRTAVGLTRPSRAATDGRVRPGHDVLCQARP
jgi:hypothetical protein